MDWATDLDVSGVLTQIGTVGGIAIGVGLALWAPRRLWRFFKGLSN